MSRRHDLVVRMVRSSLIFAGLFGAASISYAIAENKLSAALDRQNTLSALQITLSIDKATLKPELATNQLDCDPKKRPQACTSFIENSVKAKNRIKDYKLLLENTLGLSSQSSEVKYLEKNRSNIDNIMKQKFGLSLAEAKKLKILSIEQYINHISQNALKFQNSDYNKADKDRTIQEILDDSITHIQANVLEQDPASSSSHEAFAQLRRAFFAMLFIEVLIFLIVNIIDIINNNVDPDNADELINYRKVLPKTKPLLASVLLAFACMVTGQILLFRESARTLISNCRDHNKQNISFMTSLDSYKSNQNTLPILALLEPREECKRLANENITDEITQLNEYVADSNEIAFEIQGMKLRLYADGYQAIETTFDNNTGNLLLFILIMNVSALVALSIFLQYDSEDIG